MSQHPDDFDFHWHAEEPRDPRGVWLAIISILFVGAVSMGAAAKLGWL